MGSDRATPIHFTALSEREGLTASWIRKVLPENAPLAETVSACLTVWQALTGNKSLIDLALPTKLSLQIEGKVVEAALLDRNLSGPVHYRALNTAQLKK